MARKRAKYASEGNDDARGDARENAPTTRARTAGATLRDARVTNVCSRRVDDRRRIDERARERTRFKRASERAHRERTVERGTRAEATSGGELTFARGN